jgi:Na+/H+-dicarboxylate symporter
VVTVLVVVFITVSLTVASADKSKPLAMIVYNTFYYYYSYIAGTVCTL